jgi:hypothetical protein
MLSGHGDSAPLSAAQARGKRISRAAIFILLGIAVAIFLIFSYRLLFTSSNQYIPDSAVENSGGLFQARTQNEKNQGADMRPFLELQKIIPFGRSLELVGRVEAGSKLVVNNEFIEVTGDGSFKHFTKLFPASSDRVRLVLKATDLAGRTQTLTAYHDFKTSQ